MKLLYSFVLLLLFSFSSSAQNSLSTSDYNLAKKRLLIQACSMYLYNARQGAIDVDSSVVLACKGYKFPLALANDQGYNNGSPLIGSNLIEKGNLTAAIKLLTKTKGEDQIKLLLQLGSFYLFKPGAKEEDLKNSKLYLDQAMSVSNKLKIQKWQHQSLLLLGQYYYQANNQPQAAKCFTIVIEQCRKQKSKLNLAEALETQANLMSNLDPQKEKILTEVMALYSSLGMEEKRIENYMKVTTIYFWGGKTNDAKKRLYQNLADLRKINFRHQQFAETTIVFIEIAQHNIKAALYYALKSVKRMEAAGDYTFGDIFYSRLGDVYNTIGHHEEALELYDKSIALGKSNVDSGNWYRSFFSAVAALSMKGQNDEALVYINKVTAQYPPKSTFDKMSIAFLKANCYREAKNNVLTEKFFKEMDFYAKQLHNPETFKEVAHGYTIMALFYIDTKRPKEAEYYKNRILELFKTYKKTYNSQAFQMLMYKTDSINKNYESSLMHFNKYKKIYDSTYHVAKDRQIEELKIAYETKSKEEKIKLLDKETDLQETALKKSKLLNTLSIWSLVLLVLIIGLLYNRYRLKQRNNAELELKEKEINQKNSNLRHLLDEKEWLLKEIHHRVKNNLQTVISLLNSQSAYLENDMALSAIKNSQHRIHSMSLIHQKLYNSENISTINMPNYIKELVEYLRDSFSLGQRIRFEVKIEPLELDVAQAVPLGLILNESITNSIKYAFPNDRTGMIYITLVPTSGNKYLLTISDNGIGFDTTISNQKINSFGLSLIKGLSDDLEAKFSLENQNGTVLKIEFSKDFPINHKLK